MHGEGKGIKRLTYAAYGSNLHPLRLTARTPSAQLLGTALLSGWSLSFHKRSKDKSGKCTIHRGGGGVHVAIYSMNVEDKVLLDEIEGLGSGYSETQLEIRGYGGCFSYIAQDDFVEQTLEPYDWYKALVLTGARFHGFPDSYIGRIEAITAMPDPDPGRRASQWALADKLITTHC